MTDKIIKNNSKIIIQTKCEISKTDSNIETCVLVAVGRDDSGVIRSDKDFLYHSNQSMPGIDILSDTNTRNDLNVVIDFPQLDSGINQISIALFAYSGGFIKDIDRTEFIAHKVNHDEYEPEMFLSEFNSQDISSHESTALIGVKIKRSKEDHWELSSNGTFLSVGHEDFGIKAILNYMLD